MRTDRDEALHALRIQHPADGVDDAETTIVLDALETELDLLEFLDGERFYGCDMDPRDARIRVVGHAQRKVTCSVACRAVDGGSASCINFDKPCARCPRWACLAMRSSRSPSRSECCSSCSPAGRRESADRSGTSGWRYESAMCSSPRSSVPFSWATGWAAS